MNIVQLQKNVQNVINTLDDTVIELAIEEKDFIVNSNRGQLWEGKTSKNEDIRPYYSEDPYFKKPGAAERYARWKQKITPSSRGLDVPNLYINGAFYKSIYAKIENKSIRVVNDTSLGSDIISSHKDIMGLTDENKGELSKKILPKLQNYTHNELSKS